MDHSTKAIRNTAIVFVLTGLAVITGYLFRVVLAKNLTQTEYGLFYAVFYFTMFFLFFTSFGLDQALVKFIPEFLVKKRLDLVKGSVVFVFLFRLAMSTVVCLILFFGSDYLAIHYFHNPLASILLKYFALVLWLISFFILNAAFQGYQQTTFMTLMDFLKILFVFILTLVLFKFLGRFYAPIIAYVISFIIMPFLTLFIFLRFTFPDFFKVKGKMPKWLVKKFFAFGISVSIVTVGTMLIGYTDNLFLAFFRNVEDVAIYNVSLPIVTLLWFFAQGMSFVLLPLSAELWCRKKKKMLAVWVEKIQKYLFILIIPLILLMLAYPELIIKVLFDEKYVLASLPLQILAVGTVFYSISFVNSTILIGIGKAKLVSKIMIVVAIVNILLCFLLIPKLGPAGAALVFALTYLLLLSLNTFYLSRILKFRFKFMNWTKILASSFLFLFVVYVIKKILVLNVYAELLISISIGLVVYFGLLELLHVFSVKEVIGMLKSAISGKKYQLS